MNNMQLLIGQLLRIGVFIAFIIVLFGGGLYLLQHGHEVLQLQTFHKDAHALNSISDIIKAVAHFSASGIIQFGLLFLVLVQWIRVALTTWFFYKNRESYLALISLLVLGVLVYSLLINNY